MRISLLIAAGLAVLLAAGHSYLGERYILIRLFRKVDLPKLPKRTLRFAWHITSVAWLGLAALLLIVASSPGTGERAQARVIAATFGVSGVAALVGSRGRHLSWVAFLAIAALVWFGYP